MSILQILNYPDNRLRTIAKPVININKNIKSIIFNMLDTMYSKNGIGLAATQVNIHLQIIVIDLSMNCNNELIFINPKMIKQSGEISIKEACLSIPYKQAIIKRSSLSIIQAINIQGKLFKFIGKNIMSICIQHELDHLQGKLFIDYI